MLKAATALIPCCARKEYKPYWTEELQQQEEKVEETRRRIVRIPSIENNIAFKAADAKHRKTYIQEARRAWQEKTEELNLDKDGHKLWKLTCAFNNEESRHSHIALEQNGEMNTGKKEAGILID